MQYIADIYPIPFPMHCDPLSPCPPVSPVPIDKLSHVPVQHVFTCFRHFCKQSALVTFKLVQYFSRLLSLYLVMELRIDHLNLKAFISSPHPPSNLTAASFLFLIIDLTASCCCTLRNVPSVQL
jgi:hypothetical protein